MIDDVFGLFRRLGSNKYGFHKDNHPKISAPFQPHAFVDCCVTRLRNGALVPQTSAKKAVGWRK